MRVYEYKCECGEKAFGPSGIPPLCECGLRMVRDWTTNISFHGKGFFSTDNRSTGGA